MFFHECITDEIAAPDQFQTVDAAGTACLSFLSQALLGSVQTLFLIVETEPL